MNSTNMHSEAFTCIIWVSDFCITHSKVFIDTFTKLIVAMCSIIWILRKSDNISNVFQPKSILCIAGIDSMLFKYLSMI